MTAQSSRTTILVAVISLVGVLGGALIANWPTVFGRKGTTDSISPPPDQPKKTDPHATTDSVSPTPDQTEKANPPSLADVLLIDDRDDRVRYNQGGGWHKENPDYENLKSTQNYTYNPGSTATLAFRGDWIEVVYYRALGGAKMRVTIDDQNMDEIDTGTDAPRTDQDHRLRKRYDHLGPGDHTIVLTHSGQHTEGRLRSPVAGGNEPNGYYINLDGFYVSKKEN